LRLNGNIALVSWSAVAETPLWDADLIERLFALVKPTTFESGVTLRFAAAFHNASAFRSVIPYGSGLIPKTSNG
jgi:hypothetical protein